MTNSVDVLFIDEAGQMSLANVLAISQAATSLVLLGDPQQLTQPQRGVHPPGVDLSALAHLLDGPSTIDPDKGLFLKETWRLHPDICAFTSELFYDSRLAARPENQHQRLTRKVFSMAPDCGLSRSNTLETRASLRRRSSEDRGIDREVVGNQNDLDKQKGRNPRSKAYRYSGRGALQCSSVSSGAEASRRRPGRHSRQISGPGGSRCLLLDGHITPQDAPRGMEFLYSLNRLNVAISRAQCVAVLVASPALFDLQCKTPRQIELANALCRYLEMATSCR